MDEMADSIPWPEKDDQLFKPGRSLLHSCSVSGDTKYSNSVYAKGYKLAGDMLVTAKDSRSCFEQDVLAFPVIFLYRHYIELMLKEIITNCNQLFEPQPENLNHHKIKTLWEKCREFLEKACPEASIEELEAVDAVGNCIRELSKIDPHSMAFRYPEDKKGNSSIPPQLPNIDLENLSNVMQGIASFLEGSNMHFLTALEYKREMESEMYNKL